MMMRHCTYCGSTIFEESRLRRSSPYCSDECRRLNDIERRALLHTERCELCKRKFRKPKATHAEAV